MIRQISTSQPNLQRPPHIPQGVSQQELGSLKRKGFYLYTTVGATLLVGGCGVYFAKVYEERLLQDRLKQHDATVGKAAIGGPFELVDQDNKKFTEKDLQGEFTLLYFGFTHCPDICPDEMEKAARVMDMVEQKSGVQVLPLFVSVDPERDHPPQVKSYVKEFHPRMVGLTGSPEAVKSACKAYRVYYSKTFDNPDDYLVDHSIIMYLLNPEGEFLTFFGRNFTDQQMSMAILGHIDDWAQTHPNYTSKKK